MSIYHIHTYITLHYITLHACMHTYIHIYIMYVRILCLYFAPKSLLFTSKCKVLSTLSLSTVLPNIDSSPGITFEFRSSKIGSLLGSKNRRHPGIPPLKSEAPKLKQAALRYVAIGQDPSLRVPAAEVLRSSRSFEGRDAMLQLLQEWAETTWVAGWWV